MSLVSSALKSAQERRQFEDAVLAAFRASPGLPIPATTLDSLTARSFIHRGIVRDAGAGRYIVDDALLEGERRRSGRRMGFLLAAILVLILIPIGMALVASNARGHIGP